MSRKTLVSGVALAVLVVAFGAFSFRPRTQAEPPAAQAGTGARYTVVDSEGTNLTVVDNTTNTLYFYTEDPGKDIGDELHLRGSIDLSQVGKPVIKPKTAEKTAEK
jgi:hypothetical protein